MSKHSSLTVFASLSQQKNIPAITRSCVDYFISAWRLCISADVVNIEVSSKNKKVHWYIKKVLSHAAVTHIKQILLKIYNAIKLNIKAYCILYKHSHKGVINNDEPAGRSSIYAGHFKALSPIWQKPRSLKTRFWKIQRSSGCRSEAGTSS